MNRRERRAQKKKNGHKTSPLKAQPETIELLRQSVYALQQGQIDTAENLLQSILDRQPDNTDALHLLGLAHKDRGEFTTAADLIRKAVKLSPQPIYHLNLSLVLQELGRDQEALEELHVYLKARPNDTDALNSFGNLLRKVGLIDEAILQYEHALKVTPNHDGIINNLGLAHLYKGENEEAEEYFLEALSINSTNAQALNNLGLLRKYQSRKDEARELFKQALEFEPEFAEAHSNLAEVLDEEDLSVIEEKLRNALPNSPEPEKTLHALANNLFNQKRYEETLITLHEAMEINPNRYDFFQMFGETLLRLKRAEEAIPFLEGALLIEPKAVSAMTALGIAHHAELRFPEALAAFDSALELRPAFPEALCNKGVTLLHMDGWEESEAPLRRAIELAPGFMDGHWNLSLSLLTCGKVEEGWNEYALRYEAPSFLPPRRKFPQPSWDGSSLKGKRIIAWGEQGIGDEILFASVIPDLLDACDNVTIECTSRLVPLFERSFPTATVVANPYSPAETGKEEFDCQIAVPDLCRFFRKDVSQFPEQNVYLKPDVEMAEKWRDRLATISDRPKIGLTWRSLLITNIRSRAYASIDDLAPILTLDGVDFINLQCGDTKEELALAKEKFGATIHDWDDLDLKDDQDQVAAMMSHLDLVIGPTNAASYLGAALGKSTSLFLPERVLWVMLGEKDHLPWFPTSKTFAKETPHEPWEQCFKHIADDIRSTFSL